MQGLGADAHLDKAMEHSAAFWRDFVADVEQQCVLYNNHAPHTFHLTLVFAFLFFNPHARLASAGVQSNGCADGDFSLGLYTSLRNEAFVEAQEHWALPSSWQGLDLGATPGTRQFVYPPNEVDKGGKKE
jgi:hypothetical protein